MKESDLQKQIKDAINDSYLAVCYVASSGLVKSPDGKRFIRMLPEGFPDLFGYRRKDGKFFAIEVKIGTGRLRKKQVEALEVLNRGLNTSDPSKQMLKFLEEAGELAEGLAKDRPAQVIDSIGDIYVVLVVLSLQLGLSIEECILMAYDEIKDRKGRMVGGVFVKEEDLE